MTQESVGVVAAAASTAASTAASRALWPALDPGLQLLQRCPKLLGLSSEGALLGNAARDKMPSFFYNKPVGGMPLKSAPPVHVQAGGWEATATFPR